MHDINPSAIYYVLSIFVLIGGLFVKWLAGRDQEQETRFDAKIKASSDALKLELKAETDARLAAEKVLEDAKKTFDLRITAMKGENNTQFLRLAHVEREYISRADHAAFRGELIAAMKDISSNVSHSLDGFRASMEKLVERINEAEKASIVRRAS